MPCPPPEPPGADPDWCKPIPQTGGVGPLLAVGAVAVILVAVTYLLVRRDSNQMRRFVVLGVVAYLMAGLVSVAVVNALIYVSLGDMISDPLPHLLQILVWPALVASYLGGGYGR